MTEIRKENGIRVERLYLATWDYNMGRVLEELAKIAKENGGIICSQYGQFNKIEATNRTLSSAIKEKKERLEKLESFGKDTTNGRKELAELEAINNEPILLNFSSYMGFYLDGKYYHVSMDRNPFFDFHFCKISVDENLSYTGKYYLNNFTKEWMIDNLFTYKVTEEEIKESAKAIFDKLMNAPTTATYTERKRSRYSYSTTPEKRNTLVKWDI